MKVLALIYGDESAWEALSKDEREAVYKRYRAFGQNADREVVDGAELAPTGSATTVRVRGDETIVTDGPAEALAEPLAGFYVLECESLDAAAELAAQIPGAETGAIELRPAHEEDAA
jgi:hypothetical protein